MSGVSEVLFFFARSEKCKLFILARFSAPYFLATVLHPLRVHLVLLSAKIERVVVFSFWL